MRRRIELTHFSFPPRLDKDKSNFRLQVNLRYSTQEGNLEVDTAILPGLDVYWECAKDRNTKQVTAEGPGALVRAHQGSELDVKKAGVWGRRFRVDADDLYELRVSVFDVNREDWLEKVAGAVKAVISTVAGLAGSLTGGLLKSLGEEAATGIGKRMSSGDDKLLICHSAEYDRETGSWTVERGGYKLVFTAQQEENNP